MRGYVIVREREGWRRPITAQAEETTSGLGRAGERRIKWQLYGAHQREDLARLMRGEACSECLSVFPARPCKENLHHFRAISDRWRPALTALDVMRLVANEQCPTCFALVRSSMAETQYHGDEA